MRVPASVPLACLLAVLAFTNPLAASAGVEEAESLYSRGRELAATGMDAEAAVAFSRAVEENPLHGEALLQLANLRARKITTYPQAEELYLSLPGVAGKLGGRSRDDLLFRTGVGYGMLLIKSGRTEEAASILRNCIGSAPDGAVMDEAYNALGLAYYYERLYEDAIFEMRKAIKLNPNSEIAKFNLKTIRSRLEHFQAGKIYSRLADHPRALEEFRKAIDLDPRFVGARYRLGVELYLAGDPANSLKELRRASLVSAGYRRKFEIWYAEGLALLKLNRGDEALERFTRTVQAHPKFAPAHNELGKIRLERGEYDAAIDQFVKAIGLDPRTEYARGLQSAMTRKIQAQAGAGTK